MKKILVAKGGVNTLTATDPNDFIFHSDYNTLKIISSDSASVSCTADYPSTEIVYEFSHSLGYIPFVFGFCKFSNGRVALSGTKDSANDFWFTSINVLSTTIEFGFVNNTGSAYNAVFKYFACEIPL